MAAKKRSLEDSSTARRPKKAKLSDNANSKLHKITQPSSSLLTEEVDFPRGGGTTLTPAEVKSIRAEGIKEADNELFKVCLYEQWSGWLCWVQAQEENGKKNSKKRKRGSEVQSTSVAAQKDKIRIEHLTYKVLHFLVHEEDDSLSHFLL
jgi:rRNA biogenesis protein RRP5